MLFADVVWPAMILEERILTWWAIGAGLVAEFLVLRYVLNMNTRLAILADVLMNLVSTVAGAILIPLAGFFARISSFNPLTWGTLIVIAVMVNTMIEWWFVLHGPFKVKFERKVFYGLLLGNLVSVGLAFASVAYSGNLEGPKTSFNSVGRKLEMIPRR